jgi:DNA-binding response OmpR family regulator
MESYQIALVPLRPKVDGPGERFPSAIDTAKFLLLPFTWKDFLTRVRGETSHTVEGERRVVRFGQVQVDLVKMEARRSDCPVALTKMEFKVLRFFVLNPDRVISRDELLNQVWGYERYPCTRTVDNHVLRLRQKLEVETANPVHFRTVHGVGYKFIP